MTFAPGAANVNGGGFTLSDVNLAGVQIEGSGAVTSDMDSSGAVVAGPGEFIRCNGGRCSRRA